jgi:hypothetical protein
MSALVDKVEYNFIVRAAVANALAGGSGTMEPTFAYARVLPVIEALRCPDTTDELLEKLEHIEHWAQNHEAHEQWAGGGPPPPPTPEDGPTHVARPKQE